MQNLQLIQFNELLRLQGEQEQQVFQHQYM